MTVRLNEFDKDEFGDRTRRLRPRDFDFDEAWSRFEAEKLKRSVQ